MYAVLYFTNSWEWSGGYGQYLEWTGHGVAPIPSKDGWNTYIDYVSQYATCDECTELLKKHITNVVNRVNSYTGEKYIDDPTISHGKFAMNHMHLVMRIKKRLRIG